MIYGNRVRELREKLSLKTLNFHVGVIKMFGERLRQLRQKQNLSQEELAYRVGVHNNSVSKWENGVIPNMKRVIALAKILGTTATYLLGKQMIRTQRQEIRLPVSLYRLRIACLTRRLRL